MIYAERGNRVIEIREEAISSYAERGYLIYDENGTVLKSTIPTDVPNLKKAYVEHKAKIETLETEIKQLKAQIAELSAKPAKKVAAEKVEVAAEPEKEVVEEPKKAKRVNKAE